MDNPGLLGQIIESPEYYEQNKKLVERIYEEFVRFDETLSEDAKSIIREKLTFLAGTPPAVEKPGDNTVTENGEATGFLAQFKSLGKILLWIVVAIIGLFGMIFAWTKIAASRKTKISNTGDSSTPTETPDPLSPFPSAPTDPVANDGTPDWLKGSESPFGSEDVLSQEVAQSNTETHTPDWMNDHAEKEVQSTPPMTPAAIPTPEK